jgi:hypothetical protein
VIAGDLIDNWRNNWRILILRQLSQLLQTTAVCIIAFSGSKEDLVVSAIIALILGRAARDRNPIRN